MRGRRFSRRRGGVRRRRGGRRFSRSYGRRRGRAGRRMLVIGQRF